jgi:hypothetical protein
MVVHRGTLRGKDDVELYSGDVDMAERPPRRSADPNGPPNLTFTVLGVVDMFTMIAAGTMRLTLADGRSWPVNTVDGKHLKPST